MGVFGAKIPPTLYYSNIIDSNIWLTDIKDKRRELLSIIKKPSAIKFTSK